MHSRLRACIHTHLRACIHRCVAFKRSATHELFFVAETNPEPPPEPPITKGVAVVDPMTYDAMLPEEQAELQIFGFKMSFATTTKK